MSQSQSSGYLQYRRAKLRNEGIMNYEAKGLHRFEQPNILRDAYERDFRRKEDTRRFYEDMRKEAMKREKENAERKREARKIEELDTQNSVAIFFYNFC